MLSHFNLSDAYERKGTIHPFALSNLHIHARGDGSVLATAWLGRCDRHRSCVFVKSPNGYGLLIDCGSRANFSPIKWIRGKYNVNTPGFQYFEGRQYAEMIVTHLHHDHFSDVGSFKKTNDKPRTLTRDKKTLKFLEEKINEAKESGDERQVEDIQKFLDFSKDYTEDAENQPEWGFEYYDRYQLPYSRAEKAKSGREHIINNRSFIIAVTTYRSPDPPWSQATR